MYKLVEAHEGREGTPFDSIMFLRPDLTAILPLLPWCFYNLSVPRDVMDWLWWVPRAQAHAAFVEVHDAFYKCRISGMGYESDSEEARTAYQSAMMRTEIGAFPTLERDELRRHNELEIKFRHRFGGRVRVSGNFYWSPENWQKAQAALQDVQLLSDRGLQGHFVPTRPNEPVGYNHQQDCYHLAHGLRSAIGLVEFMNLDNMVTTQRFYLPLYRVIMHFLASGLTHRINVIQAVNATEIFCRPLLFGNPTNVPLRVIND